MGLWSGYFVERFRWVLLPLQESCIAFSEGPQENEERANLALYFYEAAFRLNPGIVF